ncbi:MAG TPA: hypothetical protein VID47_14065 [Actinomycetota bacterium]|jgi:hypothetical protein
MPLEGFEVLYRVTYALPEAWSATIGESGEGRHLLIGEGRAEGRVAGRVRLVNHPHRRSDGRLEPEFHGAVETDDGAVIVFRFTGLAEVLPDRVLRIMGLVLHDTGDERYAWVREFPALVGGNVPLDEPPFTVTVVSAASLWRDL